MLRQLLNLFFIFVAASSCATSKSRYGRVKVYSANDRSSFVFTVSDEFIVAHKDSPQDKSNPRITEAEAELLKYLLKEKSFCINQGDGPSFEITSRQEKIYDATFAHLIEENYRSRPLTPRTYAGKCRNFKEVKNSQRNQ